MSIFLLKLRSLLYDVAGIDAPILEQMAYKGAISAIITTVITEVLRQGYAGLNLLGIVLLKYFDPVPEKKDPLPPIGNRTILRDSVGRIVERIRKREITAVEVVQTFIDRINEVNERLTCVVDHRFDEAIEEAEKIDRMVKETNLSEEELKEKYPLLGVPFTIKDFFSVKGLRHTTGLHYRKDIVATEDAEIVQILREKGAIPIGVTNVPELCMWWESVNTVYGRSKNPYDTRHITGGSSGGEASIQGAAGSGFGIGSDIGGSIRMPAFFCGVYGHKPTYGLITNHGQEPKLEGRLEEFLTTGPIVRHPEDLSLLFDIMVADKKDKLVPVPDMRKLKIFYMEDDGGFPWSSPVDKEIKNAMHKALKYFEIKYGIVPQNARISKLYHSLEIWANGMSGAESPPFCEMLTLQTSTVNPFWEMIKYMFNKSPHTIPALLLGIAEKIAAVTKTWPRHKEMIDMGYALAKDIQELLGEDGIMLYPTHPSPAPRHNQPLFRPGDFSYCAIFNVLGVPVTQVPLGLSSKGLPLGIQVIGGMNSDLLTINIAKEIRESSFGGWIPPCHDL